MVKQEVLPEIQGMASAHVQKRTRLFSRFRKSEEGATAIEFAMVALPFFAMLFAIIETAIVLFAGQLLETAVTDTSRLILTGQAQRQNMSAAEFKSRLCQNLSSMFNCQSKLYIDVRSYAGLYEAALGDNYSTHHFWVGTGEVELNPSGFTYSLGVPGNIVIVRAFYQWPVFVTGLGFKLVNQSNDTFLLVGTTVFKTEPYE